MPLRNACNVLGWLVFIVVCGLVCACKTPHEPTIPVGVPEPTPEAKTFLSDEPPLAFVHPVQMSVQERVEETGRRYILAGTRGSRLEIEVNPLVQAIDIEALGHALISVDQGQLAEQGAGSFSAYQETVLGGEPGLRYDFALREQAGSRFLLPVDEWMYAATIIGPSPRERQPLEDILATISFRPHTEDVPAAHAPVSVTAPPPVVKDVLPAGRPMSDLLGLMWSFCPHQLAQAASVIASQLQRDPTDSSWLALDAEQKALQIIVSRQQRRPVPEMDVRTIVRQAQQASSELARSAQAQRALGLALLVDEKMSDAKKALSSAVSMDDEKAYSLLALALWHGPVATEVDPLLTQAEALDADISGIWLIRAWLAQMRNDKAGAETALRRALNDDPRNTAALIGLGRLEMDDPRTRILAAERFEQAVAVNPADEVALYNLALIRMRDGDNARAVAMVRQLVGRYPDDAHAWNLKGQILRAMGQYQEAARAYRKAVEFDDDLASAYFNLGVLCAENLADQACARQAFSDFLRLQPEGPRSRQVREWMHRN